MCCSGWSGENNRVLSRTSITILKWHSLPCRAGGFAMPACLRILFFLPGAGSSPGFPAIATNRDQATLGWMFLLPVTSAREFGPSTTSADVSSLPLCNHTTFATRKPAKWPAKLRRRFREAVRVLRRDGRALRDRRRLGARFRAAGRRIGHVTFVDDVADL